VGDGIYGVDLDGRVTFVNPSGARALGYEPDQMLGMPAHERMHAPDVDGTEAPWENCYVREAIRDGKVASAEEDRYLRADGTVIPVEITASPLLDGDRVSGAVVVFRDVTQRHEVDRMKNEFLSVVSHELRTPLTAIRGSLGLLATGAMVELTPRVERILGIAVDSSERLTRLINDILDIERIQSGRLPMSALPREAAELLDDALTELGSAAAAARVRLQAEPSTALVLADSDRIVQALTNLVGNAIKFSRPGDTVHVSAHPASEADGDMVTFCVRDQGRGIPEDKLEAVFQPFEQVDSSDAREKGGTGLGLAISRGIVEQHGGRIWAESTPGAGTVVRFTLPSVRRAPADHPTPEPAHGPAGVPHTPVAPREGEGSWQV
jgi:PAS domain S-box-containing protein